MRISLQEMTGIFVATVGYAGLTGAMQPQNPSAGWCVIWSIVTIIGCMLLLPGIIRRSKTW